MKKLILSTVVLILAFACICPAKDLLVRMIISPDTVVLEENVQEYTLTVHAEIRLSAVDPASVTLGIGDLVSLFADSRGELVAKFLVKKADLPVGTLNLTLTGDYIIDGQAGTFTGKDDISIIQKSDKDGPGDKDRKNREGNREKHEK